MKKIKGKYRVSAVVSGKRVERYFTNKEDAISWKALKQREKELFNAGMDRPDTEMLVLDYCARWMKNRVTSRPESTWRQDEHKLRAVIIPKFGKRPLVSIRAPEWKLFLDYLLEIGYKPATRNRFRSLINKLYGDAVKEGLAVYNPISAIPSMSEKRMSVSFWLEHEDIIKYLAAAKERNPRFYMFAVLALNTGMRVSEILALEWADLDFKNRTIRVTKIVERITGQVVERTKGHKKRLVPMNDVVASMESEAASGFIFAAESWGSNYWFMRDNHEASMKAAGVREISLHGLRHTFASHYIMNGGTKSELKEILGHSSEIVTEIYSHISTDHLRSRINVVGFGRSAREKRGIK